MYRLHIDIPLGNDEDKAIEDAKFFIETLTTAERVDTDPFCNGGLPEQGRTFR